MRISSTFKASSVIAGVLIAGFALAGCSGNGDTNPASMSTQAEIPVSLQKAQTESAKTLSSFLKSVQKADKTKVVEAIGTPGAAPDQQLADIRKAYPEIVSYVDDSLPVERQVAFFQIWLTSPIIGNEKAKVSVDAKKLQVMNEDSIQASNDAIVIKNLNTSFSAPPFQLIKKTGKWFLSN
jgi:hypothetical protein